MPFRWQNGWNKLYLFIFHLIALINCVPDVFSSNELKIVTILLRITDLIYTYSVF